jgi:succinate dehydrogenase flavin-adding protein (antitoxin of CptAB toxin-antitoxin module)
MNLLKKLVYKSHYRGTKEGDFILSSFAKAALVNCSDDEIRMYETLLEYTDIEIHKWVTSPQDTPIHLKPIILKISGFHKFDNIAFLQM